MSQFWSPAHMATFAKIIDLNGFSAAARALGVPKAAVSRAIAELEDELGVKLMTRTTRRLKLTPAGHPVLGRPDRSKGPRPPG
jgi:DNA-binding transcriptional LysR family regulator